MAEEQITNWVRDPNKTFGVKDPLYYERGVDQSGTCYTRLVDASGQVIVKPFVIRRTECVSARMAPVK